MFKKMHCWLASIFILALFFSANASSMQWPVVTGITIDSLGSGQYDYHITTQVQNIGNVPDPVLYNDKSVYLGHKHYGNSTSAPWASCYGMYSSCYEESGKSYGIPASTLAMNYYNAYGGTSTTLRHSGRAPGPDECIAYYIAPSGSYNGSWNNVVIPAGLCARVPPAQVVCRILSPEIVLDHGTISLQDAAGDTASASLNINCTQPVKMVFKLESDEPYIYLSPTTKAEIKIQNQPLLTPLDLPEGASILTVKDMISGVPTEGVYAASSVLIMVQY